jgi:hypothetical protein
VGQFNQALLDHSYRAPKLFHIGTASMSMEDRKLVLNAAGLEKPPADGAMPWQKILVDAIAKDGFFAE